MKKPRLARLLAMGLLVALLFAFGAVPASAARGYLVQLKPGGSNLFSAMSNMLPGETKSTRFSVQNVSDWGCNFNLEAKIAEEAEFSTRQLYEEHIALLSQLDMKVVQYKQGFAGSGTVLYEGKVINNIREDLLPGERNIVSLGYVRGGKQVDIEVTVSVPNTLNNNYDGTRGMFWWFFLADTNEDEPGSRVTSDVTSSSSSTSSYTPPPVVPPPPAASSRRDATSRPPVRPPVASVSASSRSASSSSSSSSVSSSRPVSSSSVPVESIAPEPTPTAEPPGSWALLNLIISILCIAASLWLLMGVLVRAFRMRKRQENEDDEQFYDEEERRRQAREDARFGGASAMVFRMLSVFIGIFTLVVFFVTQDLTAPMQMVDKWTPWMILLAAVDIIFIACMQWRQHTASGEKETDDDSDMYTGQTPPPL